MSVDTTKPHLTDEECVQSEFGNKTYQKFPVEAMISNTPFVSSAESLWSHLPALEDEKNHKLASKRVTIPGFIYESAKMPVYKDVISQLKFSFPWPPQQLILYLVHNSGNQEKDHILLVTRQEALKIQKH